MKKTGKNPAITVSLTPAILKEIQARAEEQDRSMSQIARHLIVSQIEYENLPKPQNQLKNAG